MTLEHTLCIMAATIYASKLSSNSGRKRLATLRREANEEARELCDLVRGVDDGAGK